MHFERVAQAILLRTHQAQRAPQGCLLAVVALVVGEPEPDAGRLGNEPDSERGALNALFPTRSAERISPRVVELEPPGLEATLDGGSRHGPDATAQTRPFAWIVKTGPQ
jgi:hypothetical protein